MSDDARWAARYQFLAELWRGRDRLVLDPELERVLIDGGPGVAHGSHPPLAELLDTLLPRRRAREQVCMITTSSDAADISAARSGTTIVSLPDVDPSLDRQRWSIAIIDIAAMLVGDGEVVRNGDGRHVVGRFDDLGRAMLQRLAAGVDAGKIVVLVIPVRDYPRSPSGFSYEEAAGLLGGVLGGGRMYGMYSPTVTAIVDFSESVEASDFAGDGRDEVLSDGEEYDSEDGADEGVDLGEEEREDNAGGGASEDDGAWEVDFSIDNTLGTDDPRFTHFIAVAGLFDSLTEGPTLVELPPVDDPFTAAAGSSSERALRVQLAEARRQADLAAIERQALLEQLDDLRARNFERVDRGGRGRDEDSEQKWPVVRVDELLARERTARARLEQLEYEVELLRRRPVDQLEAELASLTARLELAGVSGEPPIGLASNGARSQTGAAPWVLLRADDLITRLVRRLERDAQVGALELRRELLNVRQLLRTRR